MFDKIRLIRNKLSPESEILFEHKILSAPSTIHWHNFYEIDIVLSGTGKTTINGETYTFEEGFVFFMAPSDFHDFVFSEEIELFNIQFTEEGVPHEWLNYLIHTGNRFCQMKPACFENLKLLIKLFETSEMNKKYLKTYHSRLLENILLLFLECIHDDKEASLTTEPELIREIVVYIHAHFTENPPLKELSRIFHVNENYLCSLFKKHLGQNYKTYLRVLKINHAKKLLLYTDMPITEIALNSGYNSQSGFNRDFQSIFHISPREMRNSH